MNNFIFFRGPIVGYTENTMTNPGYVYAPYVPLMLTEQLETTFDNIALPMVRRVFADVLGQDLVSVQPMNEPIGMLTHLDYTYDKRDFKFFRGYEF
jgi:hypothetical protein